MVRGLETPARPMSKKEQLNLVTKEDLIRLLMADLNCSVCEALETIERVIRANTKAVYAHINTSNPEDRCEAYNQGYDDALSHSGEGGKS